VLEVGLTKNGLQLGHGLLRELGGSSLRHCGWIIALTEMY
jgi:hypothetical protein